MLLRIALAGWLLLGAACGDDAAAEDAGVDGGHDAGRDLGTDAGPRDMGPEGDDAAIDGGPDDPGWVPLPDLPLGCEVDRALYPERLFDPTWSSCGEGCLYLEQDPDYEVRPTKVGGHDRRTPDGESYVFTGLGLRRANDRTRPQIVTLVGTDGTVPIAYRTPNPRETPLCMIGEIPYVDGWAGFTITMRNGNESLDYDAIFHGPIDELKDADRPVLLLGPDDIPGYGAVLEAYVSPEAMAFHVPFLSEVWLVDTGILRRLGGPGSAVPVSPQRVALVGDHVLWNEWRTDVRIAHGALDRSAAPYYGVEGTRVIFATDGVDLAWVQGYGWDGTTGFDRMELWTAPYVREPADLAPRRVLESYTQPSFSGVVGAGSWVVHQDNKTLGIVELASGERLELGLDDPRAILLFEPVWVTDEEIAIVGRWDGEETLFRLSRDRAELVE